MIRNFAFFGFLLLAACGPTGNSPEAVCDREAYSDPVVKELLIREEGNPWLGFNDQDGLGAAKDRARRACLSRLGVLPGGGGVEPVRRPDAAYRGIF